MSETSFPWPPGSATAVGSYPGVDPAEALRVVLGELPELPHLPELPARGPGADLAGRAASLLIDLPVGLEPSGWRFVDRPGRDLARARDLLARDLDVLEEQAGTYQGPFKVQVAGPWTLAGTIELRHGDRALADSGAVRDLIASLAEGVAGHVAEVGRRVPAATIVLQIDEPHLPGALAGTVPTASGFGRLRAVEASVAENGLRQVMKGAKVGTIVHCCASGAPYGLLRAAGAGAIAIDLSQIVPSDDDAIGEAVDAGVGLLLGAVPATDAALPALATTAAPIRELGRRLGFPPRRLAEQVVVTPACGLVGASPGYVRTALARCREVARMLHESAL